MRDPSDSKLFTIDKANDYPKLKEGPVLSI
ncbi:MULTISPECIES: hypothetical protein [Bacillus]